MKIMKKKIVNNKEIISILGIIKIVTENKIPRESLDNCISSDNKAIQDISLDKKSELKAPYDLTKYRIIDNESCVVLGNGPSFNTSLNDPKTFAFIKEKPKVCVNYFPLTNDFFLLKPEYLVLMDPNYWAKDLHESGKNKIISLQSVLSEIDWHFTIFIPHYAKKWNYLQELPRVNKFIEIQYINTVPFHVPPVRPTEEAFVSYSKNINAPLIHNVLVAALFIALNIGYKKIYLFGADHDIHNQTIVKEDNIMYFKIQHFYDENTEAEYHPCYKTSDHKEVFSVSDWLYAWYLSFKGYEEIEQYANFLHAEVYNASVVSFIDAFKRIKV